MLFTDLKYSQNFFKHDLPYAYIMCTLCLFFMLINNNIIYIKKTDGICLPTFAVD